jgi:hypothetical protein
VLLAYSSTLPFAIPEIERSTLKIIFAPESKYLQQNVNLGLVKIFFSCSLSKEGDHKNM